MLTLYEKIPNEIYVFNKSKNTLVKRPVYLAFFKDGKAFLPNKTNELR